MAAATRKLPGSQRAPMAAATGQLRKSGRRPRVCCCRLGGACLHPKLSQHRPQQPGQVCGTVVWAASVPSRTSLGTMAWEGRARWWCLAPGHDQRHWPHPAQRWLLQRWPLQQPRRQQQQQPHRQQRPRRQQQLRSSGCAASLPSASARSWRQRERLARARRRCCQGRDLCLGTRRVALWLCGQGPAISWRSTCPTHPPPC